MVSDQSSRAEIWTDLRKIATRIFLFEQMLKNYNLVESQLKIVVFRETKSLRSYPGYTKVGKHKHLDIILFHLIKLSYL